MRRSLVVFCIAIIFVSLTGAVTGTYAQETFTGSVIKYGTGRYTGAES